MENQQTPTGKREVSRFVLAIALETHKRAGIHFPANEEIELEIVSTIDESGKRIDDGSDPKESMHENGRHLRHDARRIGWNSYQLIRNDIRIKVLEDGGAQEARSQAAMDEARSSAGRLAEENSHLRIDLAGAEQEIVRLGKEVERLKQELALAKSAGSPPSATLEATTLTGAKPAAAPKAK